MAGRVLRDFIPTYFDVLGREWDRSWTAAKEAFPNLLLVAFELFGFFTSIPFLPLYAFVEDVGRSMLPNAQYYRRYVITGYDAFKLVTEITTKSSLKAGLIDTTFVEQIIVWIASRIWVQISGGGLIARIRKLIGLTDYNSVLNLVRTTVTKNIAMQLMRWFMVWFAVGYAMITMVAVGVYWNEWFQGLQQNNPRAWGSQRNRIRRPSQSAANASLPKERVKLQAAPSKAAKTNATRSSSRLVSK